MHSYSLYFNFLFHQTNIFCRNQRTFCATPMSRADAPPTSSPSISDIEDSALLIKSIHEAACNNEKDSYPDPATGYTVFTRFFHLRRGYCCGSGCRYSSSASSSSFFQLFTRFFHLRRGYYCGVHSLISITL